MKLNAEQTLAVEHPLDEAALMLAGAGSGKTRVVTERIEWLIKGGVPPKEILAITFTNKAAREILDRVLDRTGLPREQAPKIVTIHSLALGFIRRNPEGFHLDRNVTPLDERGQYDTMRGVIDTVPVETKALLDKIRFLRARNVGFAAQYTVQEHERIKAVHSGSHALNDLERSLWKRFEQAKQDRALIDFDDMLWLVNRRMEEDPGWAKAVGRMYRHVLLDEAQDTNYPQWTMVNHMVAPGNRNLFVVGDIAQSIYSWNGAQPDLIVEYAKGWRGAPPIKYKLECNYRSTPEIVRFGNAVNGKMKFILPLKMKSMRGEQGERGGVLRDTAHDPIELASHIVTRIVQSGTRYDDWAVLVRTHLQVRDIENEFLTHRIPYVVRGGKALLQTEEIRDILAWLRLAINPKDFAALERAAAAPRQGIGDKALAMIQNEASLHHGNDLIKAAAALEGKAGALADKVTQIMAVIESPVRALERTLAVTQYRRYLDDKYGKVPDKRQDKYDNIQRLVTMFQGMPGEATTMDVIFQVLMDRQDEENSQGAVTISTMHAAKGLEWGHVYVFNVVEGVLPHGLCQQENEIEEERRLFYVAMTRGKDFVYIGTALRMKMGKNWVNTRPSPFLVELGVS